MKLIISFMFLLVAFTLNSVQATTYYVSNAKGDDSTTGSQSQPWKTIQKAANTLVSGDTVYIMAGTYLPSHQIEPNNSGTIDHYINYFAYPGDEHLVIIDGTNIPLTTWYGIISISSKEYIKISGLKIINSSYAGILIENSKNIIIEKNNLFQTYSSGISVWDSDTITIGNNEIRRACWPTGGEQECITISTSNMVSVTDNHVLDGGSIGFGGGGEGIDLKDGCSNSIVCDNSVHDIASVGIYIDAYSKNQNNIHVYNNTVYNISGVGITAASEEGGNLKNVIINNNVIFDCSDRGMVIHWTDKPDYLISNIFVMHNTIVNNAEGLDIGAHSLSKEINIINNIFSNNLVYQIQNSSDDLSSDELQIRNNLLNGDNPSWTLSGDNYIIANPEFIDTTSKNFHLKSNSPAINEGMFLTKATNSGTGTLIKVENAGFFSNYNRIKSGDIIQIEGKNKEFEIIDVNYADQTITINQPTSWNSEDGISLKYCDRTPDIGAFEFHDALRINSNWDISNSFELFQNYPNPFNPETTIRFNIPKSLNNQKITVSVFDISGRKIATLLNKKIESGYHKVTWNGANSSNILSASGIYFYQIKGGNHLIVKKMILMR